MNTNTATNTATKLNHGDEMIFKSGFYVGSIEHCAVCERRVGANPLWVEVYAGGSIWDESRNGKADQADRGYMGHYPVGSECAKKFEAGVLKVAA